MTAGNSVLEQWYFKKVLSYVDSKVNNATNKSLFYKPIKKIPHSLKF